MSYVLFVIFVVLPFVDLALLLRVGDLIGFWPTVALTLASAVLGAWLAKREGLRVLRAWRRAIEELRMPDEGIIDGVLVIAGGALLAAPGDPDGPGRVRVPDPANEEARRTPGAPLRRPTHREWPGQRRDDVLQRGE